MRVPDDREYLSSLCNAAGTDLKARWQVAAALLCANLMWLPDRLIPCLLLLCVELLLARCFFALGGFLFISISLKIGGHDKAKTGGIEPTQSPITLISHKLLTSPSPSNFASDIHFASEESQSSIAVKPDDCLPSSEESLPNHITLAQNQAIEPTTVVDSSDTHAMERSPSHQTSEGASQLVIEPSASLEPSKPDQPSINDLKSEITWLGIFVSELQGINCKLESTIKDMEIEREKQLELREQERGAAAAEARSIGATHAAALAKLTNEVETGQVAQAKLRVKITNMLALHGSEQLRTANLERMLHEVRCSAQHERQVKAQLEAAHARLYAEHEHLRAQHSMAQRRIADLEDAVTHTTNMIRHREWMTTELQERLGKLYGVLQRERARSSGESPSLSDAMAMDSPKQPARLEAFGMDISATQSSSSTLNISVADEENVKGSKVEEMPRCVLADKSNMPDQPGTVEAT